MLREFGADPAALDPTWAVGRTTREVFAKALRAADKDSDLGAAMRRRLELAPELLIAHASPMPRASQLLGRVGSRVAQALVTSTDRPVVDLLMARLGWEGHFDVVVTADDVVAAKPSPEPYLQAARALNVPPTGCLVVEDSLTGLAAARASGARVAVVLTSFSSSELEGADWVLEDLAEVVAILDRIQAP